MEITDPWYIWKFHISYKDREDVFKDALDYLSGLGADVSCIAIDIPLIKLAAEKVARFHYRSAVVRYLRQYCDEDAEIIADGIEYVVLDKYKRGLFKKRLVTDFKPKVEWRKLGENYRRIILNKVKDIMKKKGEDLSWLDDELFEEFVKEDDFYKITEHDFLFGMILLQELAKFVGYEDRR